MAAPTIRRIFVVLEEAGLCGADAGGTPLSGGTGLAGDGVRGGCQAVTGAAGTGEGNTDALGEALPVTLRITRVPHCSQKLLLSGIFFPHVLQNIFTSSGCPAILPIYSYNTT